MGRRTILIERQIAERLGKEKLNNQGCLMKIVEYNNATDITVEFQDEFKTKIKTAWKEFSNGVIKNPYYPKVYGVGMVGNKYQTTVNHKQIKEYEAWCNMLRRCYSENEKQKYPKYKDSFCCNEWLLFENFYEWLHSQANFNKWLTGNKWAIDKDILVKGNKMYSPETCSLVPSNVNGLFLKHDATRGNLPIGVSKHGNGYQARCQNPITSKEIYLGTHDTTSQAFIAYKKYKENLIKQIAEIEYSKGNITENCYNAMINYKVEITD